MVCICVSLLLKRYIGVLFESSEALAVMPLFCMLWFCMIVMPSCFFLLCFEALFLTYSSFSLNLAETAQ